MSSIEMKPQMNADERRFVDSNSQRIIINYRDSDPINSPQRAQRLLPCVSVPSVKSAFHYNGLPYSLSSYPHINCVSAFICVHLRLNNRVGGA